jgi:hypothetical protein
VAMVDESTVSEAEMRANVRLIAAAPDLLAALKNILKSGFSREAEAQAAKAIAKAEGRQP